MIAITIRNSLVIHWFASHFLPEFGVPAASKGVGACFNNGSCRISLASTTAQNGGLGYLFREDGSLTTNLMLDPAEAAPAKKLTRARNSWEPRQYLRR